MTDPNSPAFPEVYTNGTFRASGESFPDVSSHGGFTKREQLAAMAMQGILSNPDFEAMRTKAIAAESVHQADALIEALNAGAKS